MEREPLLRTISTRVHGRYLVRVPDGPLPSALLVGFHGYAEDASIHLTALERIPDLQDWVLVAVQALHPFYTKSDRVVASWMTRQDRELALADNVDYVKGVVDAIAHEFGPPSHLVFAGFSQGGAMAYRAAANIASTGVLVLAADVPPDVVATSDWSSPTPDAGKPLVRLPPVLIGRGVRDKWYSEQKMAADVQTLQRIAPSVETCVFDGEHEWTDAFTAAAAGFVSRLRTTIAPATLTS